MSSRAVWVSIDPRTGDPSCYAPEAAARLEQAHQSGAAAVSVPLSGLGGFYEGAVVDIAGDSAVQRTSNGRRDVRRIELLPGMEEVVLHVVREQRWRAVPEALPGFTEERRLNLRTGEAEVVRVGEAGGGGGASGSRAAPPRASWGGGDFRGKGGGKGFGRAPMVPDVTEEEHALRKKAISEAIQQGDAEGLVGLWEWCRLAAAEDFDEVPAELWGVYSEEQNAEIEAGFRELKSSVKVTIGIREYEICFEGPVRGKQVDHALRKRRHVRRRLASPEDQRAMLLGATAAQLDGELAEMDCAICCAGFAETLSVPVVRLTPCGHSFHGACVQQVADRRGACPCCRAEVDWEASLRPLLAARPCVKTKVSA